MGFTVTVRRCGVVVCGGCVEGVCVCVYVKVGYVGVGEL